jgi:N-glycosylase/DNA lyase
LTKIATLSYLDAKSELMTLSGVGEKVADCVLLFSYQRYEAVPIDVWIKNIITKRYFPQISDEKQKKMSYEDISVFCRHYFGQYSGYAQQFIYAARE